MKLKKLLFMFGKFRTDLKRRNWSYNISNDLHSQKLGEYYFVFEEDRIASGKDQNLIKKFDDNGIPLNSTYIDVAEQKFVYFPISIGQMGLSVFHTYLNTKKENDKSRFLKFVDWFYNNAEITTELGALWITHVPLPQYKYSKPWHSAFSQSRGLSILLRGYQLTNDKKYADMAEKALIPFTKSIADGGVTSITEWGLFYEEYAVSIPSLVLNGMVFSLFGIYDFIRVFPENKVAKKIFDDGVETLKKILPEYDMKYWSKYNLCKADWYPKVDPSTITYQGLHISQMKVMYAITGESVFKEYLNIFQKQYKLINMFKMYLVKYKSLKKIGRL
jgi:heparosan-N-sulfate-glucuronate 5-epimerase